MKQNLKARIITGAILLSALAFAIIIAWYLLLSVYVNIRNKKQ